MGRFVNEQGQSSYQVVPLTGDLHSMVAKFNGKCQDHCGLTIHAGYDEVERGHFGWRHVDCGRAQFEAWVRERFAAGDDCCDIQFKIAKAPHMSPADKMAASGYALVHADRLAEEAA